MALRALHRAGYANQPTSERRDDGLELSGAYVTAVVRCAPPANKPTTAERDTVPRVAGRRSCALLGSARVLLALGSFAWDGALRARARSAIRRRGRVRASATAPRRELGAVPLLGSFHPSQQNTFTGKLTVEMLDGVFARARELADDA